MGVGIDRFLLNRHKGVIHNKLLAMWVWLDDFRIPEFHKFMAESAVRAYRRVMGTKALSWRPWVIALEASVLLTLLAIFVGGHVALSDPNIAAAVRVPGPPGGINLAWWLLAFVGVNFIFDVVTVIVTVLILRKIARTNVLAGVLLITVDLGLAFLFAILCLRTLGVCESVMLGRGLAGGPSISDSYEVVVNTLSLSAGLGSEYLYGIGLYALTTFIPTGLYLLFLLLLIPARASLYLGKRAVMYFCEKGTEPDDPKDMIVFTLLGTFFSLVGLLLKGLHFLLAD